MHKRLMSLVALSVLVVSSSALGQEDLTGRGLSVFSGRTLGVGNDVITPEIGWPGIQATYLHGMKPGFDIGGKFAFNYGSDFAVSIYPAINFHAVMRFHLMNQGIFSMALETEPGFGLGFSPFAFIIYLPVALQMSLHPIPSLSVLFSAELRPTFGIGNFFFFGIPILLLNPGVEYALSPNIALTFRTAFGPGVTTNGVGFTFRALMGVTIKV